MTFLQLQKTFMKHLAGSNPTYDKNSIPEHELNYIIAVVKYIDARMNRNNDHMSIVGAINNMRRIVKDINECTTGIGRIDHIAQERMKEYIKGYGPIPEGRQFTFYRNPAYTESLISILSQYGGLYKYVCSHADNSLTDDNWNSILSDCFASLYHR